MILRSHAGASFLACNETEDSCIENHFFTRCVDVPTQICSYDSAYHTVNRMSSEIRELMYDGQNSINEDLGQMVSSLWIPKVNE